MLNVKEIDVYRELCNTKVRMIEPSKSAKSARRWWRKRV